MHTFIHKITSKSRDKYGWGAQPTNLVKNLYSVIVLQWRSYRTDKAPGVHATSKHTKIQVYNEDELTPPRASNSVTADCHSTSLATVTKIVIVILTRLE